ncbi:MAG: hypothetical protein N2557_04525 [Hydrogenophilus sp.]|nr:hypothetical protein [Hydrogenophilus sp.]
MKIVSSTLNLTAAHQRCEAQQRSLSQREIERPLSAGRSLTSSSTAPLPPPVPSSSRAAAPAPPATPADSSPSRAAEETAETDPLAPERFLTPELRLLKTLLHRLFGSEAEASDPYPLVEPSAEEEARPSSPTSPPLPSLQSPSDQPIWVVRATVLEANVRIARLEALTFSASGVVQTADGRTISFAAGFALARHEETEINLHIATLSAQLQQRPKDPLVLDFAGAGAQLADIGFRFDLMGDGTLVNLPVPLRGAGFLVFDRNGNGRVDDGRELFGPRSGDGFRELAQLDDDRNGWIDESDSSWSRLYVWHPFQPDRLIALADLRIGALATTAVATPFSIDDSQGHQRGQLQKSSIYLKETGEVGTISHLDLNV